tara:strand:+ start:395 stop:958 length:564 start_codon:yes stop_codon:yes gene_type:complete
MADRKVEKARFEMAGTSAGITRGSAGPGVYWFQEEVSLVGANPTGTNHGRLTYLTTTVPAQSVFLGASMTVTELANIAELAVELIATDDATEGRGGAPANASELCGAGISADAGGTATDLECGSGATLNMSIARTSPGHLGTTNILALCNGDASNTTSAVTSGKVMVTVWYAGSAAPNVGAQTSDGS